MFPFVFSAHYIVGYANDALDGTVSNGHRVVVWNEENGIQDNVTDVVGVTGNSNLDRMYLVDCDLLSTQCEVGDELSLKIYDTGDNYVSSIIKVNVTGAGYDFANNLTMNSPIIFNNVIVDDSFTLFLDEIDLIAASTRKVFCNATVEDLDGGFFESFSAKFFSDESSFFLDSSDNNHHYTNSSCFFDTDYGNENQSFVSCSFDVWYYANPESWKCVIEGSDFLVNYTGEDFTTINPLLALEIVDSVDFGIVDGKSVSTEAEIVVYNKGNSLIDLALSGYGYLPGDELSMYCSMGENISLEFQKYNVSSSTPGDLDVNQFNSFYTNLTSAPVSTDFNLNFRTNDLSDEAYNSTFWRIYVPPRSGGNCSGNIVFGAVMSI